MKSEMGYKFKGSGFNAPEEKRKYEQPRKGASRAFEKWMDLAIAPFVNLPVGKLDDVQGELYDNALKIASKFEIGVDEGHALLLRFHDDPRIIRAGIFISAVYNQCPDRIIVHDLDLDLGSVGMYLKDKILINTGKIGLFAGKHSHSAIINFGQADRSLGSYSTGPVINYGTCENLAGDSNKTAINYGKAGHFFGMSAKNAINLGEAAAHLGHQSKAAINFGKTGKSFGSFGKIVINKGEEGEYNSNDERKIHLTAAKCAEIPALDAYLENVRQKLEKGRTDYNEAISAAKSLETLSEDLEGILGRQK